MDPHINEGERELTVQHMHTHAKQTGDFTQMSHTQTHSLIHKPLLILLGHAVPNMKSINIFIFDIFFFFKWHMSGMHVVALLSQLMLQITVVPVVFFFLQLLSS